MKITGIIAEYNPFHNGHDYQLRKLKETTDTDYTVILMSGNFVQRGAPALLDKFARARMALTQGADLVLELPALWSCASAEFFAGAAVGLLDRLGCIDRLCFGCETPESGLFAQIRDLLSEEPPGYKAVLADALRQGKGYARAREQAILSFLPQDKQADALLILQNPNNILALEYDKALAKTGSGIKACPVRRQGGGHHSGSLDGERCASATAIRAFLKDADRNLQDPVRPLRQVVPEPACSILLDYGKKYAFLSEHDFSSALYYALVQTACRYGKDGFLRYADVNGGLSHKIYRILDHYLSYPDFCAALKSKDLAYTRVSRCLLHIMLGMEKSDYSYWKDHGYAPCIRLLGFRRKAEAALSHIKKHSSLPVITRAAETRGLSGDAASFFAKQTFADDLYRGVLAQKSGRAVKPEYRRQLIVV